MSVSEFSCPLCKTEVPTDVNICPCCGSNLKDFRIIIEKSDIDTGWPKKQFFIMLLDIAFIAIANSCLLNNHMVIGILILFISLISFVSNIGTFLLKLDVYKLAKTDLISAKVLAYQQQCEADRIKKRVNLSKEERQIREAEKIEQERKEVFNSYSPLRPEWDRKYFRDPCPHCGHYRVRYANWDDKKISVAVWGIGSSKISKKYYCENCRQMW